MYKLIVGTYEMAKGFHIITTNSDGKIEQNYSNFSINNCSYGDVNGNLLYFISERKKTFNEQGGRLIIAQSDNTKYKILANCNSGGSNPCHITFKDKKVFISNYNTGNVTIFDVENPKSPQLIKKFNFGKNSLVHCSLYQNQKLHVVCKGTNTIHSFNNIFDKQDYKIMQLKNNLAPRHIICAKDNIFFVITENNSNLLTMIYNLTEGMQIIDIQQLEKNYTKMSGCAIKAKNNRLYVTLRSSNLIKVFDISNNIPKLMQTISSLGEAPRDFDINESDAFVTNQNSNTIQHFLVDENGILTPTNTQINISKPCFVKIKRC